CIALLPACAAGVLFFGYRSAAILALSVAAAVLSELFYCKAAHMKNTIGDFSAVVTGMLLAMNLPSTVPYWMPVVGAAIAILLCKMIFGGIGQNFMNPALASRAILALSWASMMNTFATPAFGNLAGVDAVASATPISGAASGSFTLTQLLLGNVPGTIGETCKLALLIGAAYLLWRRVISWHIPAAFIGTFAVCYLLATGFDVYVTLYQLLSGGLILGAFFMATDYSTSPATAKGKIVFGVGCGLLLFIFRYCKKTPAEWCSFAILLMNVVSPLIERVTGAKSFGEGKKNG
ncbi:MAG: RnfABCDGE type electron transport complex subunit D, partial [Clostridia bacterium]|nr:RnfABCDGE type electron transport complex subunit D [Clostridia bacterium]